MQFDFLKRQSSVSPMKQQKSFFWKFNNYISEKVCDEEQEPQDGALRPTWSEGLDWNDLKLDELGV